MPAITTNKLSQRLQKIMADLGDSLAAARVGCLQIRDELDAMEAARKDGQSIRAASDANGRRWRVEGPGWTMQPEGILTAEQAETICRAAAHALTLNEAVTAIPPPPPATEWQNEILRSIA